ncbi:MAG TPA: hypothetical protein VI815_02360 [Candidatus Nanoarchaeia archaeon]|nr:hypothetical protein [Candidatus Nanoarchaeia archaeon]
MSLRKIKTASKTLKKQQIISKATTSKLQEAVPELLDILRSGDYSHNRSLQTIEITISVTYDTK